MNDSPNLGKIVVIDLEQACWEHQPPGEIIEIGVCLLTVADLEISKPRRIFIKPEKDEISSFCSKLTGITQDLLDAKGKSLSDAKAILLGEYKLDERVWAGWGSDGQELAVALGLECNRYINLCDAFSVFSGSPNRVGLDRALEMLKLQFKGNRHTGGDDAYNASVILRSMMTALRKDIK